MRLFTALALPAILAVGPAFGDALAEIKERGSFVFGLEAQYRPFEFRDENNEIIGYDIDVAAEIGKRLGGVEPVPVDTNWATVIQSLYNGDFDFILGGMTATAERFQRVNFSYPYMDASSGILVAADSGINTPSDLAGKSVSAGAGTPQIRQLRARLALTGISYNGYKQPTTTPVVLAVMKAGPDAQPRCPRGAALGTAKTVEGVQVIPFTSTKWSQNCTGWLSKPMLALRTRSIGSLSR
ncbi:MAG: substrate-binding periplasmic protein [Paracoccaceae bacterium]